MKLELKHLAKRLPYGLRILNSWFGIENLNYQHLVGIINNTLESNVTPILRPLSDLTKEIEHKGEKFVPIIELAKIFHNPHKKEVTHYIDAHVNQNIYGVKCCTENKDSRYMYYSISKDMRRNQQRVIEKLLEWHFDTDMLIKSRLAVDVSTLDVNPYK